MKNRISLAALALVLLSVCASAQNKSRNLDNLSDDFGFYAGAYVPMYKGQGTDVVYGVTYGHFNSSGLGFRTGLQFVPRVAEVDNSFGIPVVSRVGETGLICLKSLADEVEYRLCLFSIKND